MSVVKMWEDVIDYQQKALPMLEIEGVLDFNAGQNNTWALQLKDKVLIIPKGSLVIEAFEE